MRKFALIPVVLAFAVVSACSKTPKQEAIAGFYDGCYIAKDENLKKFCDCVSAELDNSLGEKFFDEENPGRTMAEFANKAKEFSVKCKNQGDVQSSIASEANTPAQSAYKKETSVPVVKESPEDFLERIEAETSAKYNQQWSEISVNPDGYINRCTKENANLLIDRQGFNKDEAIKSAQNVCISELSELRACMEKKGSDATSCFVYVFERGD